MMFEYSFHKPDIAKEIEQAIEATLAAGFRTSDIANRGDNVVSTKEMTEAIVSHIGT